MTAIFIFLDIYLYFVYNTCSLPMSTSHITQKALMHAFDKVIVVSIWHYGVDVSDVTTTKLLV